MHLCVCVLSWGLERGCSSFLSVLVARVEVFFCRLRSVFLKASLCSSICGGEREEEGEERREDISDRSASLLAVEVACRLL